MRLPSAIFVILVQGILSACTTLVAPRYSTSADTGVALKALGASSVGVGPITDSSGFDGMCRAVGPLAAPDNLSHAAFIKKALETELKVAGAYAAGPARVTISGVINRLGFSSMRGITGGAWDIDMTIRSSNGKSMAVSERYDFESGFDGSLACKQTAEAYTPAVQDLIEKIVSAPEFRSLIN